MKVLLYGIARQRIHYDGRVIDLMEDRAWRHLVKALRAHVPLTRPPMRREHDPRTSGALGYVSEVVGPVMREQLIRGGVPGSQLPHQEYVLFRANLTPRGAQQYRGGDIARTSIGLAFDVRDDQGRAWPYFLEELSVVDRPHIRVQPTAQELSGVTMRAGARHVVYLAGAAILGRKGMLTDEQKDRLVEGIAALVAEIFAGPGEPADEVAEEAAGDVLEMLSEEEQEGMAYTKEEELAAALAAQRAEVARLKANLGAVELGAKIDRSGMALSAAERQELIAAGPKAVEMAIRFSAGSGKRQAAGGRPEAPVASRQEELNRKLLSSMKAKGGAA